VKPSGLVVAQADEWMSPFAKVNGSSTSSVVSSARGSAALWPSKADAKEAMLDWIFFIRAPPGRDAGDVRMQHLDRQTQTRQRQPGRDEPFAKL
jgi:hypothetical protein